MEQDPTQIPDQAGEERDANPDTAIVGDESGSASPEHPVVVPDGESETEGRHALPFPVVGIGGSAGSLEPFIEVFQKLPVSTGMAFVVVLHLLPNQESICRRSLDGRRPCR